MLGQERFSNDYDLSIVRKVDRKELALLAESGRAKLDRVSQPGLCMEQVVWWIMVWGLLGGNCSRVRLKPENREFYCLIKYLGFIL